MLTLDPSGTEAAISIDARLGASEVERLIRELSGLRRRMLPAATAEPDFDSAPKAERSTAFVACIGQIGACDLWLRDPALGWIACHLPIEAVVILQDGLRQAASNLVLRAPIPLRFDPAVHVDEEW